MNIEEKYTEWRRNNPLRRWREENGVSRATVCAAARVTLNTIVKWEAGSNVPNRINIERLAKLMDKSTDELAIEWFRWLNEGKVSR